MKKYEYFISIIPYSINEPKIINDLGKEGWELIIIIYNPFDLHDKRFYFKREIHEI